MADTQRSLADILLLLADNITGDISPQDIRDMVKTVRPRMGQIAVTRGNGSTVSITTASTYVECTSATWTVTATEDFDESAGNGRLTYTGVADVMVHVACTISASPVGNNDNFRFKLGLNGTPDNNSEVELRFGNSTDARSTALHLITTMQTGHYISLWVANATDTDDIELIVANLQAMSMPM